MRNFSGKTCAIIGEDINLRSINRNVLYERLKDLVYKQKVRNFLFGEINTFTKLCNQFLQCLGTYLNLIYIALNFDDVEVGKVKDKDLQFDYIHPIKCAFLEDFHIGNLVARNIFMIEKSDFVFYLFDKFNIDVRWDISFPLYFAKHSKKRLIDFRKFHGIY